MVVAAAVASSLWRKKEEYAAIALCSGHGMAVSIYHPLFRNDSSVLSSLVS